MAPTEMFALTENICVDKILALTKCWRRLNTRNDKILASTKYSRRQNSCMDKMLAQAQKYLLTVWPGRVHSS